ncbi:zinc finger, CCHC-type containing protein [Tanacetum coccineum]
MRRRRMQLLAFQHECGVCADYSYSDDGDDATVDQLRKRAKWDNDHYVCRGLILKGMPDPLFDIYQMLNLEKNYEIPWRLNIWLRMHQVRSSLFTQHKMNMDEAIQVSCIIDKLPPSWKDFKHTLKHKKEELTLVELGSHLRIEESFKAQDSDKPNGNIVVGPQLNIINDNIGLAFMSTSKLNVLILWHARLGHVHFKRMQDMSKDGLIHAFDMDTKKCKTCMLAKITKKPFQNVKHETKVLELIHSDLCDLHATPSLRNKKYFVTFIDDPLRIDRGCEYMDTLYFQSIGIIHETTAPYTPQQNGISEKKNRVKEACIFVGYAEHSKDFRFSLVPRPSLRIPNRTEDIGGSVVPKKVTEEVVQQPEHELRKSKRNRTPKNFGPKFQLYLIERTRDEVSDQHSYCFHVEDDPKTFDEAMKSQDVAFWKEAINDEMDSIMGNNTWVLADLPSCCKPLGCKWIFKRKLKVDGIIEKFKERLVIQGFKQKS